MTTTAAETHPMQPMFAFARTVLDEVDAQTGKLVDAGAGQMHEALELARTMRAQATEISRVMLGSMEQAAAEASRAMQTYTAPFTSAFSSLPFNFQNPFVAPAAAPKGAAPAAAPAAAKGGSSK